ncbi:MAG: PAS domain-containing sensor histidine kinase [Proteobacteria bacterium]|nr:PAS domain-containing sensor histidine kinase [Pseudomonadota bacterium]
MKKRGALRPAGGRRAHADEALGRLASYMPGLVFQLRLLRDGRFCFPYASEAMREIFRFSPDEARADGAKFLHVLHPADVAEYLRSIQVSARDLSPWRHQFRIMLENGRTRWLNGYGVPEREADESVLWHGFIGYATGHTSATTGQAKSEFLSVAAHELREPVSTICGFADVLLNQTMGEERQREFLSIISGKLALLASVIGDLSDLARIEARQGEDFVFARTDVGDVLREVVAAFGSGRVLPAPVLRLPAKPVCIVADRNKVVQALTRVLARAHQCSPPGEAVRISVQAQSAGGARLIGIRIANQTVTRREPTPERIRSAGAPGEGQYIGLGMSVVREIVDLHGGRVLLQRTAVSGTRITLLFPESVNPKRTRRAKTARPRTVDAAQLS